MRFLFTTLQTYESDFYGRVGAELERTLATLRLEGDEAI